MITVATLNHNQGKLTDNLVEQLKLESTLPFRIWVIDNGSISNERSKYTTHQLNKNRYFGGGTNFIFKEFNKNSDEYLWLLNNDLIFNGHNIVRQMKEIAENGNYDMLSPSITNAHQEPCHWKHMWNWHTGGTRDAKWLDLQAPLLSRRLCEDIGQFPEELHLGWGLDFYSGMTCEDNDWKVGVTDNIDITHLDSKTLKDGKVSNYTLEEFCADADKNMHSYFANTEDFQRFKQYRSWSERYSPNDF